MAETTKKPEVNEIATTGKDLDIFGGYFGRLPNRDATLLAQGGGKGLALYDEVARDPHAGSVLQTRALAVTSREWEVVPASESPRDAEIAEFVKNTLLATNFDQARAELLSAVLYGFRPAEVMWGVDKDGKWIIERFLVKHPRRFVFDMERQLRLLTPGNMIDGEPVPDRKFITFTYGSSDDPYGCGLGQSIYWPVWFKKNGIKFWLIFLDKFGSPTIVGKYQPGTPEAEQNKLLDAIDTVRQETGIVIPEGMALELLEAARNGQVSFEAMCDYMDRAISKRVLGQTLTTEVKGEGSYAASKTHDGLRQELIKADADLLSELLNKTLLRWLVDLNFAGVVDYPQIWVRTDEGEDLKALSERDKNLKDNGVRFNKEYYQSAYGLDPDHFEVAEPSPSTPSTMSTTSTQPEFAEGGFTPAQQALESLADKVVAADPLAANEQKLLAILQGCDSYEEAFEQLLEAYPTLDMGQLEDLLGRAIFAAGMHGRRTMAGAMNA